jgi:alpha-glucosidase
VGGPALTKLADFLPGRRIVLEACHAAVDLHPTLEPPPAEGWDEGPPRNHGWKAVDLEPGIARSHDRLTVAFEVAGASMTGATIERLAGERFWGFGVRSDEVERSDGVVECWAGEGPYQLEEYALVEAITPRWAIRRRRDATYYPVPWVMSSHGYGVLVDNTELSRFRFTQQGVWSVEVLSDRLALTLFRGDGLAELLARFTEHVGRQPYPAAPWFLGPWVQTGHADLVPFETEKGIVETLRDARAPAVAIETHMRRLPGGAHESNREPERARTRLFAGHGLKSLGYLNPFVSVDYTARFAEAEQLLQRRADGTPYLYPAYIGGREPPLTTEGQLDFSREEAVRFFTDRAAELLADGHDGWMEDFGEYTPPDSLADHNRYPDDYHAAGARAAAAAAPGRAVARFGRSGWTGTARHLPLVWGGDPTTGWGFDGLRSALTQALSAGLSGIAFFGSDIGGFFSLRKQRLDDELLIRWIQLGAMSPLMRTKAEGIAIPRYRRPQVWDPQILPHWKRWSGFHVALLPYLLEAAREYVDTGMPLMRHMCLAGGDPARSDQYMLGPDLLVAPVLEEGARRREVALPPGGWVHLWLGHELEGGQTITVPAPLDEIPVFARAGTRFPIA